MRLLRETHLAFMGEGSCSALGSLKRRATREPPTLVASAALSSQSQLNSLPCDLDQTSVSTQNCEGSGQVRPFPGSRINQGNSVTQTNSKL
jgi:hypothetical protein